MPPARHPRMQIPLAIIAFIGLVNIGLVGLILGGFTLGTRDMSIAGRLLACTLIAFAAAGWIGLRIRSLPVRIRSSQAMAAYSLGMLLSIVIPLLPFPFFYLDRDAYQVGPLLVAQSLFMIVCIGIKMNTSKHRF